MTTTPSTINGFGSLVDRLAGPTAPVVARPAATVGGQEIFPSTPRVTSLPADTLQIGNQRFGQAVGFAEIREVRAGVEITDQNLQQIVAKAASLTKDNGFDEIYFLGEDKKLYVAFAEKSRFQDVRVGYLGRANVGGKMQSVEVMHVEDEDNTFGQGVMSTWRWLNNVLLSSFGSEASKSVSGLVTTAVGSFVAAAALKGAPTAAAETTTAAAGGFLKSVGGAFTGAVSGFLRNMASVVMFGVGAVAIASLVTGLRGAMRKGDATTIDMVTGRY